MTKSEKKIIQLLLSDIQKLTMDKSTPIKFSAPLSVCESRLKRLLNVQPTLF